MNENKLRYVWTSALRCDAYGTFPLVFLCKAHCEWFRFNHSRMQIHSIWWWRDGWWEAERHVTEVTRWIWTCDAVVKPCESPLTTAASWVTENCFPSFTLTSCSVIFNFYFFQIRITVQVQGVRVMWPGWLTHWHICGLWYKEHWHSRCRMNWNWSLLQDVTVRQQT